MRYIQVVHRYSISFCFETLLRYNCTINIICTALNLLQFISCFWVNLFPLHLKSQFLIWLGFNIPFLLHCWFHTSRKCKNNTISKVKLYTELISIRMTEPYQMNGHFRMELIFLLTFPQLLQWWRRRTKLNGISQDIHFSIWSSGTHCGGSTKTQVIIHYSART